MQDVLPDAGSEGHPAPAPGSPAASGDPPRAPRRFSGRGILAGVLLALVMVVEGAAFLRWAEADDNLAEGVCCALIVPMMDVLRLVEVTGPDPTRNPWTLDEGILTWFAIGVRSVVGGGTDFTFVAILLALLATQLCLFFIGRRLAGPFIGVLAAALFPLYPAIAFVSHRWDINVFQFPFLAAAALALYYSRSFNRLLPSTAFIAVAIAGACLSPRRSENLLLLFTLACMAGGAVLRTLVTGRGPEGSPALRWKAIVGALVVAVMTVGILTVIVPGFSPGGYIYYPKEVSNPLYTSQGQSWNDPDRLLTYAKHLYQRGMTPAMAIPTALLALAFAVFGRGRAELLTWIFGPLAMLSVIPKKNYYYLTVVYPAIPLIAALGVGAMRFKVLQIPVAIGLLAYGGVMVGSRSFPESELGRRFAQVKWQEGDNRMGTFFQTIDFDLDLSPMRTFPQQARLDLLKAHLTEESCDCPAMVYDMSDESKDGLWLGMSAVDPCITFTSWPDQKVSRYVSHVLVKDPSSYKTKPPMKAAFDLPPPPKEAPWTADLEAFHAEGAFEEAGRTTDDQGRTYILYRRPEPWFEEDCRAHWPDEALNPPAPENMGHPPGPPGPGQGPPGPPGPGPAGPPNPQ